MGVIHVAPTLSCSLKENNNEFKRFELLIWTENDRYIDISKGIPNILVQWQEYEKHDSVPTIEYEHLLKHVWQLSRKAYD